MKNPTNMVCDKKFTERGSLRTHMRRHGGNKPYTFSMSEAVCWNGGLNRHHMFTHSGEKPHKCDL